MTDQGLLPNVTEAGDSMVSDESCADFAPVDTTNKNCEVKEMFHNIDDKIVCLLNLLNGNIHKVVCLEGLTNLCVSIFQNDNKGEESHCEDCMLQDALCL